ncbi:MAG: hypothetical protein ABSE39_04590 [Candidatus Bathyarchaeia archaeon]
MKKKTKRQVPISAVLVVVAVVALVSFSVGQVTTPVQYFTQSVTTFSEWTTKQFYPMGGYTSVATETWGRVCGNSPWNMTNITAQCNNEPIPEFSGIAIVAFAVLAACLYLLRRRRR